MQPETEDVISDAAIDLLDQTESENIRGRSTLEAESPDDDDLPTS